MRDATFEEIDTVSPKFGITQPEIVGRHTEVRCWLYVGMNYPPQNHDEVITIRVEKGSGTIRMRSVRFPYGPNDFFTVNPGNEYQFEEVDEETVLLIKVAL